MAVDAVDRVHLLANVQVHCSITRNSFVEVPESLVQQRWVATNTHSNQLFSLNMVLFGGLSRKTLVSYSPLACPRPMGVLTIALPAFRFRIHSSWSSLTEERKAIDPCTDRESTRHQLQSSVNCCKIPHRVRSNVFSYSSTAPRLSRICRKYQQPTISVLTIYIAFLSDEL
jgi:hypothetical protein